MFLGIATPSEAAATGVLATVILSASQRKLTWRLIRQSIMETVAITSMICLIIAAATAFSQIMAISGAARGLLQFACGLPLPPILLVIIMQLVGLFMGMVLDSAAIMMICMPLFTPIIEGLGFNPIWFGVIFLINIEAGLLTPPFGLLLFVAKGASPDTSMAEIVRGAVPFVAIDMLTMALVMVFPQIALFLPGIMR